MNSTITIEIPAETRAELEEAVREEGSSAEEIAATAIKDYLFIRRFRGLQKKLTTEGDQTYTDEEIFEKVS